MCNLQIINYSPFQPGHCVFKVLPNDKWKRRSFNHDSRKTTYKKDQAKTAVSETCEAISARIFKLTEEPSCSI